MAEAAPGQPQEDRFIHLLEQQHGSQHAGANAGGAVRANTSPGLGRGQEGGAVGMGGAVGGLSVLPSADSHARQKRIADLEAKIAQIQEQTRQTQL